MGLPGKFGVEFVGDATKDTLVLPRILVKVVALWPDTMKMHTTIYPIMLFVLAVFLQAGQLAFFVLNISDINKMAATLTMISATFQTLTKTRTVFVYSNKLKNMVMIINKHFWSSDLMGVDLEKSLKYSSKIITAGVLYIYTVGVIFCFSFLSLPVITGKRELPFASSYPFDWHKSPTYQIVYFLQSYVYMVFVVNGVIGHDSLFLAITTNCVAQFKLLKFVLSKIGSPEIDGINKKLDQYYDDGGCLSGDTKLFCKCIEHHRKIIDVCNDLEAIFTISVAVQFLASLTSLCVSSYLLTATGFDPSQLPHLLTYVSAHFIQFFVYCTAGNQLTYQVMPNFPRNTKLPNKIPPNTRLHRLYYDNAHMKFPAPFIPNESVRTKFYLQASSLSTYLFNSQWYKSHVPNDIKKALPVVMQRSQKCQKLTALGIADLNYTGFLKVLQLSFSFYTFLSNMNENK